VPDRRSAHVARANGHGCLLAVCLLWAAGLLSAAGAIGGTCENAAGGEPQLYWGDLHVHTAYSLDAYAFGSIATPKEAYAFARGQPLRLGNGEMAAIDRPLDFAAVTDHAASFDVMYLCTDPVYRDNAYCNAIREGRDSRNARFVIPGDPPAEFLNLLQWSAIGVIAHHSTLFNWMRPVSGALPRLSLPCR
jgi:hypothetical protein